MSDCGTVVRVLDAMRGGVERAVVCEMGSVGRALGVCV